jgi:hypothetical protein
MKNIVAAAIAALSSQAAMASDNPSTITCQFAHPDFARGVDVYIDEKGKKARPTTESQWTEAEFTADFIAIKSNYPYTPLVYSIAINRRSGSATFVTGPSCEMPNDPCDEARVNIYHGSCAARF